VSRYGQFFHLARPTQKPTHFPHLYFLHLPTATQTTHRNLISVILMIEPIFSKFVVGNDAWIGVLPMYHIYGCVNLLIYPYVSIFPLLAPQITIPQLISSPLSITTTQAIIKHPNRHPPILQPRNILRNNRTIPCYMRSRRPSHPRCPLVTPRGR
jgi:hypothetical protein